MRYKMPRPRKYDYQKDYPVTIFVKVPIKLLNTLENDFGYDQKELSKLVIRLLEEHVKRPRK